MQAAPTQLTAVAAATPRCAAIHPCPRPASVPQGNFLCTGCTFVKNKAPLGGAVGLGRATWAGFQQYAFSDNEGVRAGGEAPPPALPPPPAAHAAHCWKMRLRREACCDCPPGPVCCQCCPSFPRPPSPPQRLLPALCPHPCPHPCHPPQTTLLWIAPTPPPCCSTPTRPKTFPSTPTTRGAASRRHACSQVDLFKVLGSSCRVSPNCPAPPSPRPALVPAPHECAGVRPALGPCPTALKREGITKVGT